LGGVAAGADGANHQHRASLAQVLVAHLAQLALGGHAEPGGGWPLAARRIAR
jgi:hypothetical protein